MTTYLDEESILDEQDCKARAERAPFSNIPNIPNFPNIPNIPNIPNDVKTVLDALREDRLRRTSWKTVLDALHGSEDWSRADPGECNRRYQATV